MEKQYIITGWGKKIGSDDLKKYFKFEVKATSFKTAKKKCHEVYEKTSGLFIYKP